MNLDSVKDFLKKIMPAVGACVSVTNPLAGIAINTLTKSLGISEDQSKDEIVVLDAIKNATPEQLIAMKNADKEFQLKMQEIGFKNVEEMASLEVKDRMDARNMQIQTKSFTVPALAFSVTLGFFAVLVCFMFKSVPSESRDILNILMGSLGTAWIQIISYYFGSSIGSDKKTEIMAAQK